VSHHHLRELPLGPTPRPGPPPPQDAHLNLSTDMLLVVARDFMRAMAQPYDRGAIGKSLLSAEAVEALEERHQADKAAARGAEEKQRAAAAAAAAAGGGAAMVGGAAGEAGGSAPMELG
jgi:hypothetical protein